MMDSRALAQRAREAREDTGLSQNEAADQLGVSRSGVSKAENWTPEDSMYSLRIRMIEELDGAEVEGPFWRETG